MDAAWARNNGLDYEPAAPPRSDASVSILHFQWREGAAASFRDRKNGRPLDHGGALGQGTRRNLGPSVTRAKGAT
jgi:hypothetical protein